MQCPLRQDIFTLGAKMQSCLSNPTRVFAVGCTADAWREVMYEVTVHILSFSPFSPQRTLGEPPVRKGHKHFVVVFGVHVRQLLLGWNEEGFPRESLPTLQPLSSWCDGASTQKVFRTTFEGN